MDGAGDDGQNINGRAQENGVPLPLRLRTERVLYAQSLRSGLTKSCGCAKPVPSAGRRPKAEKTGAQSDPVGDEWMFGNRGSKGLFARRR